MIKIHIDNPATSTSAADSEYSRNYGTLPQLSEAPCARFSIRENWKTRRKISSYKRQQTKYSSWRFLNIKKIDFDTKRDFSNTEKFQVSGFFGIFIKGKSRYCAFFEIFIIEYRNSWFFQAFHLLNILRTFFSGNLEAKFFLARARTRINWCVEWWLDDMYLKVPLPLPINSSPGMIIHQNHSSNGKF